MAPAGERHAPLTLEAIRAKNSHRNGGVCSIRDFLRTMTPADAEVIRKALVDRTCEGTAITRTLRERGYGYGRQVVERHRREGCASCGMKPLSR